MSQWGGNKKKRPRDNMPWGAYYANKNANKKDRYAEFDSSASRAINAGQQPTLARKRRQLAEDNHKWGNDPASNKRAQDIFQDLIKSHRENNSFSGPSNKRIKFNPVLVNGRKRFWKRKLSNLSTRDCDVAWNEGRNNFLKFINNQGNEAIASTASNDSAGTDPKGNGDQSRTGTHKNKKAVDDPKPKPKKPSATNSQKPSTSDKPNPSSGTKEVGQKNLDVIDLCDSDSDNEISDAPSSEKNLKSSHSKKNVTATGIHNKQLPTKKEAGVSESIAPVTNFAPTTVETANKPISNEIPEKSTLTKQSIPNRWADLFLGPNFRTDHVFSLDKENFLRSD